MTEIDLIRTNHLIDPSLHIWGWEIPVYLFLGGITAGIMILCGITSRDEEQAATQSFWLRVIPLSAPILLSIGMFALFLDLAYKFHVYRFYLAFKWSSPMSWGSWILLAIYPVTLLLGLINLKDSELKRFPYRSDLLIQFKNFFLAYRTILSQLNIAFGIGLGIYTGILLSALGRSIWNSGLLGPLFLASGLSAGAAFLMLLPLSEAENEKFKRWDLGAMSVELGLLILYLINLTTVTNTKGQLLIGSFWGGPYTLPFWGLVILMGLILPFMIETIRPLRDRLPHALAPLLILLGGFSLRWIMVMAGQLP